MAVLAWIRSGSGRRSSLDCRRRTNGASGVGGISFLIGEPALSFFFCYIDLSYVSASNIAYIQAHPSILSDFSPLPPPQSRFSRPNIISRKVVQNTFRSKPRLHSGICYGLHVTPFESRDSLVTYNHAVYHNRPRLHRGMYLRGGRIDDQVEGELTQRAGPVAVGTSPCPHHTHNLSVVGDICGL